MIGWPITGGHSPSEERCLRFCLDRKFLKGYASHTVGA